MSRFNALRLLVVLGYFCQVACVSQYTAGEANRRYLATHRLDEQPPLRAWESEPCRRFYSRASTFPPDNPEPLLAVEDLHMGGREYGVRQHLPAQEVIVSDRYKFVFTIVRKSGSATIRQKLSEVFGATWSWCDEQCAAVPICYTLNRCSTYALNRTHLNDYYFFSFVRNPISRWMSAYAQAHVMWDTVDASRVTLSHALETLREMNNNYASEHHLQSQVHSLSSLTFDGTPAPMHFIGRIERLDEDWVRAMNEIEQRAGVALPADARTKLVVMHHRESHRQEYVERIKIFQNSCSLRYAILGAYTQDFVCFGYNGSLSTECAV